MDGLKQGMKVEMEHKRVAKHFGICPKRLAKMIALDHLAEDKNYYKKLKTVEGKSR